MGSRMVLRKYARDDAGMPYVFLREEEDTDDITDMETLDETGDHSNGVGFRLVRVAMRDGRFFLTDTEERVAIAQVTTNRRRAERFPWSR